MGIIGPRAAMALFVSLAVISAQTTDVDIAVLAHMSASAFTSSNCPTTYTVANGTCWLDAAWQSIAVMTLMAVDDFNERNGLFVSALGTTEFATCDKRLAASMADAGTTIVSGAAAVSNLIPVETRPHLIIGPPTSAASAVIAPMLGTLDVVNISPWASSTDLSDTSRFPRFMRTYPSDDVTARAVCAFWADMGTAEGVVLYQNDLWGRSLMEGISTHCFDAGINTQAFEFDVFNPLTIEQAVTNLAASRPRYVFVAVLQAPNFGLIVNHALAQGMLADDDQYSSSWTFSDGVGTTDFDGTSEEARAALNGSVFIRAMGARGTSPTWQRFATQWQSLDPNEYQARLPAAWKLRDDFFRAPAVDPLTSFYMRDVGVYFYDAVMAAGLMACAQVPNGPPPANLSALIWEAKESFAFDGLSGHVGFNAAGDRTNATFLLSNAKLDNAGGVFVEEKRALFVSGAWQWYVDEQEQAGAGGPVPYFGTRQDSGLFFNRGREVPPPAAGAGDGEQGIWASKSFKRLSGSTLGITAFILLVLLAVTVKARLRYLGYRKQFQGTMRWVDDDSECIPGVHHVPKTKTTQRRNSDHQQRRSGNFHGPVCHWRETPSVEAQQDTEASLVEPAEEQSAAVVVLQRKIRARNAVLSAHAVVIQKVIRGRAQRLANEERLASEKRKQPDPLPAPLPALLPAPLPAPLPAALPAQTPISTLAPALQLERHLEQEAAEILQKRWRQLKNDKAKQATDHLARSSSPKYDLFLSHSWGSGGQEKARIVKTTLHKMMPSLRIFLDVDDLVEGRGKEGVDRSDVVLIFLTQGYLHSTNCMRELLRAVFKRKRIIVMGTREPSGVPRRDVPARLEEALTRIASFGLDKDLARWGTAVPTVEKLMRCLFKVPPIEFHSVNQAEMGIISFRQVAQLFLHRGHPPTYVQGELTLRQLPTLPAPRGGCTHHLYVSVHNIGARQLCAELIELVGAARPPASKDKRTGWPGGLQHVFGPSALSADHMDTSKNKHVSRSQIGRPQRASPESVQGLLRRCEQMLVYLSADTWTSGAASEALCREIMDAMTLGVRLLLVHEVPSWDRSKPQACSFDTFFECARGSTPLVLLHAGIYHSIATPVHSEQLRTASMVKLVGEICRTDAAVRRPNEYISMVERQVLENMSLSRLTRDAKLFRNVREAQELATLWAAAEGSDISMKRLGGAAAHAATHGRQLLHAATGTGEKVPEHLGEGVRVVHGVHGRGTIVGRVGRRGQAGVMVTFDHSNARGPLHSEMFTFGSHKQLHIMSDAASELPPSCAPSSWTRPSLPLLRQVAPSEAGTDPPSNVVAPSSSVNGAEQGQAEVVHRW